MVTAHGGAMPPRNNMNLNQPVSRLEAAGFGATHELYEPRLLDEAFWRSKKHMRSWQLYLETEMSRLHKLGRTAIMFHERGKVGLAVNCLTEQGCSERQPKKGMH